MNLPNAPASGNSCRHNTPPGRKGPSSAWRCRWRSHAAWAMVDLERLRRQHRGSSWPVSPSVSPTGAATGEAHALTMRRRGRGKKNAAPLSFPVDMTSAVKCSRYRFFGPSSWRPLRPWGETEPVNATVDHADIRGLATTLLVSVGRLPRSRHERLYVRGGALKNGQIRRVSDAEITYRFYPHGEGKPTEMTLAPEAFLRRYLQHVPEHRRCVVRSYGLYAPTKTAHPTSPVPSHTSPPSSGPPSCPGRRTTGA
jgi:Putative transposase